MFAGHYGSFLPRHDEAARRSVGQRIFYPHRMVWDLLTNSVRDDVQDPTPSAATVRGHLARIVLGPAEDREPVLWYSRSESVVGRHRSCTTLD